MVEPNPIIENLNSDESPTKSTKLNFGDQSQTPSEALGDDSPKIITEEKLKCYEKFANMPVIVEGPEQS